jgi:hypothetical protein
MQVAIPRAQRIRFISSWRLIRGPGIQYSSKAPQRRFDEHMKTNLILTMMLMATVSAALTGCGSGKNDAKPSQVPQVTAADEMAARVRLLSLAQAEQRYQAESGGEYGSLDKLKEKGYWTDPSGGQLNRYKFEVSLRPHGFEATAEPEKYGVTGTRSFYVDESQTLHGADKAGEKATASDPTM